MLGALTQRSVGPRAQPELRWDAPELRPTAGSWQAVQAGLRPTAGSWQAVLAGLRPAAGSC